MRAFLQDVEKVAKGKSAEDDMLADLVRKKSSRARHLPSFSEQK